MSMLVAQMYESVAYYNNNNIIKTYLYTMFLKDLTYPQNELIIRLFIFLNRRRVRHRIIPTTRNGYPYLLERHSLPCYYSKTVLYNTRQIDRTSQYYTSCISVDSTQFACRFDLRSIILCSITQIRYRPIYKIPKPSLLQCNRCGRVFIVIINNRL